MTELQLTEIRNYLLTKKLPVDILMEVQDHFVSQINDLQREQKLGFEEAFTATKVSWEKELKPYWKGGLSLEDVSDFMRRMRRENELSNLRWALKWGWIPLAVIFAGAFFFKGIFFGIFTLLILAGLILYALVNYLKNRDQFVLSKRYQNQVLTLHQHSVFIFFLILSPVINIFNSFLQDPEKYRDLLLVKGGLPKFIFLNVSLILVILGVFFSLSAQKNYLRQIEKIKPFLKYLKSTN